MTSPAARSSRPPTSAPRSPAASGTSRSTCWARTPTPSASSSSAASPPRTRRSTSCRWTWSGPPSSPRPAGSCPGPTSTPRRSSRGRSRVRSRPPTYQGKLWAAPANSNTQLLWYRKDLVKHPPDTWDGLIDYGLEDAQGRAASRSRARAYEGLTVWFNALVASAGGQILNAQGRPPSVRRPRPRRRSCTSSPPPRPPTRRCRRRRRTRTASPSSPGAAAFQVNYPFIYPSAQGRRAGLLQEHRLGAVPEGRRPAPAPGADRRLQLGRRRLHQAPGRGLPRRRLPARRRAPSSSTRRSAACRRRCRRSTTTRSSRRPTRSPS